MPFFLCEILFHSSLPENRETLYSLTSIAKLCQPICQTINIIISRLLALCRMHLYSMKVQYLLYHSIQENPTPFFKGIIFFLQRTVLNHNCSNIIKVCVSIFKSTSQQLSYQCQVLWDLRELTVLLKQRYYIVLIVRNSRKKNFKATVLFSCTSCDTVGKKENSNRAHPPPLFFFRQHIL